MARVVTLQAPYAVRLRDEPDPPLAPGEVRVATLYSGISAGTELAAYRGSTPFASKRWDPEQRLFLDDADASLPFPVTHLGYEEVGRVVELGPDTTGVALGGLVYGTWGHRSHAVLPSAEAVARALPEGVTPRVGIFSHIGAVALNGVLDGGARIGESVAVFGLGVVGQIVAQLCARSGARVIGVDPIEQRRRLAARSGAVQLALDPSEGSPAEAVRAHTGGRGADVTFEASGVARALHEAIRTAAYGASVVALGFFQGEASGLYLGEEFHHNRVQLRSSQIGSVAPERSQRWDRQRLTRTVFALQAEGALDLDTLITHTFDVEDAAAAYRLLADAPAKALQVVLRFPEAGA